MGALRMRQISRSPQMLPPLLRAPVCIANELKAEHFSALPSHSTEAITSCNRRSVEHDSRSGFERRYSQFCSFAI